MSIAIDEPAALDLTIRPATAADYDDAARLFQSAIGDNFTLDATLWNQVCSGEGHRAFVGENHRKQVVALSVVIVSDRVRLAAGLRRRRFHLDELIVDPAHRRQGIGRAMLEHIKAIAEKEAPSYIIVNCDFMNVAARRTYESAGLHLVRQSGDRFEVAFR
jgi:ribosomal protein S18 acetylase RimI-like enzyme